MLELGKYSEKPKKYWSEIKVETSCRKVPSLKKIQKNFYQKFFINSKFISPGLRFVKIQVLVGRFANQNDAYAI